MSKICFLVGSLNISGGTYVILQHAWYLHSLGHDVTLAVQEPFTADTLKWHDKASSLKCVFFGEKTDEEFDLVIVTWWKTALEMFWYSAKRYAYFVQSIESKFYPDDEVPLKKLVDATYQLPVTYVTEASWIKYYLKENYSHHASLVLNGIRKDIYYESNNCFAPRPVETQPRVLIEGHLGVSFKNTALAIKAAKKAGAKDVWMLTGTPIQKVPYVNRVFSKIPANMTQLVYRSCDFLVKLSTVEGMFGPPLELFHCGGTAVVYNVSGHDEYIENHKNGIVIERGDIAGVIATIRRLLGDRDLLDYLKEGALLTAAKWPSWQQSSEAFAQWTGIALNSAETDRDLALKIITKAWADYDANEKQRLAENPSIERNRMLEARMQKMPICFHDGYKTFVHRKEVYLRDWQTH